MDDHMTDLHHVEGDVFEELPRLTGDHFHGCLTDPPYLWDFMNRAFDRQHKAIDGASDVEKAVAWNKAWLSEVYRVLVPGAYAAVFQGSKTAHRLAYAAEIVGFEVLPMLVGITGQAMAQGGAVGKLIDREAEAERTVTGTYKCPGSDVILRDNNSRPSVWGQCSGYSGERNLTSPATPLAEDFDGHHSRIRDQIMPIVLLLKPCEGSYARNAEKRGVAGLNVDGCRSPASEADVEDIASRWNDASKQGTSHVYSGGGARFGNAGRPDISRGRFPGNVLLDSAAADEVGEQSGWSYAGERTAGGRYRRDGKVNQTANFNHGWKAQGPCHGDAGTAARFFQRFKYIARAPKSERLRGLEHWHWEGDSENPEGWRRLSTPEALELDRLAKEWEGSGPSPPMLMTGTNHPTVKPLELTEWVARLILPPMGPEALERRGGATRLLVPFSGVCSETVGGARAGWPDITAIEKSPSYVAQGAERFRAWGPYGGASQASLF